MPVEVYGVLGLRLDDFRFWSPGGPNGFPDTNGAWAAPEQLKLRLDVSFAVARQFRDPPTPTKTWTSN